MAKYNIEIQSESLTKNFKRVNNSEEGSRQDEKEVDKAKNGENEEEDGAEDGRQNLFSDLLGTADEDAL